MHILLVDDAPVVREALGDLLSATFGSLETHVAAGAQEAREQLAARSMDLVLVNLASGALREGELGDVVEAAGPSPVAVLDIRCDALRSQQARTYGVKGYIPWTSPRALLGAALGVVASGGVYVPDVAAAPSPPRTAAEGRLSARQRQVMQALARGMTNREIADALGISVATVKLHVHAILAATGTRNRTEAVVRAGDWAA